MSFLMVYMWFLNNPYSDVGIESNNITMTFVLACSLCMLRKQLFYDHRNFNPYSLKIKSYYFSFSFLASQIASDELTVELPFPLSSVFKSYETDYQRKVKN